VSIREGPLRRAGKAVLAAVSRVVVRCTARRAGVALLYHAVEDPPPGRREELVPSTRPALFQRQLRHLRRAYAVVPASELPAAAARRRRFARFPIALTFDDDHPCYERTVKPLLVREGVTATFFLNGACAPFWWQRLQAAWDLGLVNGDLLAELPLSGPQPSLRELGDVITRLSPDRREAFARRLAEHLPETAEPAAMQPADIRSLASAGFEIGFHTRAHDYLPALDDEALQHALVDGRDTLGAKAALAYPSGGVDRRVVEVARRVGWRIGYTTRKEAVTPRSERLMLGRIVPPPSNASQLALEIVRTLAGRPRAG
jgi:peptidoglycan/xylan/chitin deacetylase (PgdA/CDA1 family)